MLPHSFSQDCPWTSRFCSNDEFISTASHVFSAPPQSISRFYSVSLWQYVIVWVTKNCLLAPITVHRWLSGEKKSEKGILPFTLQAKQFCRLYEHIKNDKYLVGQRLVNYNAPAKASSPAAASTTQSGNRPAGGLALHDAPVAVAAADAPFENPIQGQQLQQPAAWS